MAIDAEFLTSLGLDDAVMAKITERSAADEAGLVSKRDELLGKVTTANDSLKRFEGIDPDKWTELQTQLAELQDKDLTVEERIKKAEELATNELKKKLALLTDENADLLGNLSTVQKERIAEREDSSILKAVGDTGAGAMILAHIRYNNLVETVEVDGKSSLKVHSLDKSKDHSSIDELLSEMKANDDTSRLFNSSGLSGGDARRSQHKGSKQDDGTVTGAQRMARARRTPKK